MKILVCGASGFIGRAVCARLAAQGHEVLRGVRLAEGKGDVAIDFSRDLQPSTWRARLQGVDAVVNAVGIIREHGAASFGALHARAPAALFVACAEVGVRRVVQISALGADGGDTPYFASKRTADAALMALPLEWIILRPSLVFGAQGDSAQMFCQAASMPVMVTPALGEARFQPLHIDDLAQAVATAVDPATPARRVIDAAGRDAVSYDDMLATYRAAMGFAPAPLLHIPAVLMACAARVGGKIPGVPLTPDNWRMLRAGSALASAAAGAAFSALLGRAPRAIGHFIGPAERELLRLRALANWRKVLMRWTLAIVWLATAVISVFVYQRADSLALLASVGLREPLATPALYGAAALDAGFGIASITWPRRALWLAQAALIVGYSAVISICLPEFLWHPFGPLLKNLPILAMLTILYAEEKQWIT